METWLCIHRIHLIHPVDPPCPLDSSTALPETFRVWSYAPRRVARVNLSVWAALVWLVCPTGTEPTSPGRSSISFGNELLVGEVNERRVDHGLVAGSVPCITDLLPA
ncbi:hypothetical protein BDV26DRAFT_274113 [Aspergillus bertholletiae]|uniref:Uncharacterized protein n=1 Tax=Aspergillus bertholletiae TaxID=1226010 RepID=A0A5N7AUH1_9EURO|nr:hypothetical protein BDV26DRAFT_274113 [Aspergillus bertholletiae]